MHTPRYIFYIVVVFHTYSWNLFSILKARMLFSTFLANTCQFHNITNPMIFVIAKIQYMINNTIPERPSSHQCFHIPYAHIISNMFDSAHICMAATWSRKMLFQMTPIQDTMLPRTARSSPISLVSITLPPTRRNTPRCFQRLRERDREGRSFTYLPNHFLYELG